MSDSPHTDLIRYRLQQAQPALQESRILHREKMLLGAINRAYYAMFYSVEALAVASGERFSKHSGTIAFFDRVFVKTGIFPRELSKNLHMAFEQRQISDYGEISQIEEAEVSQLIQESETFVERIESYLQKTRSDLS